MNLSREEAQQILGTLENHPGNYKLNTKEAKKHGIVVDFLQSRLEEPDAGANVEFPTPAYLRVSDDPVDISIIDYYTESQLRSYADARVAAARLAEGEQEPTCPDCEAVVMYECVACSKSNYPEATSTSNSTPLEAAATKLLKHWDAKHMFATAVLIEQIRVILPQPYAQQAP